MKTNKFNFQTMTTTETEDLSGYEEAFDFVFEDSKLLNIAITGPYGSGKSSVIETYEKKKKKKFIYVSLATFKNIREDSNDDTELEHEENRNGTKKSTKIQTDNLEGKILNQIIHQIDANNLPQTDFKTKKVITSKDIIKTTFLSSLFLVFSLLMLNFSYLQETVLELVNYNSNKDFILKVTYISFIVSIIIWIILLSYFIYHITKGILHDNLFKRIKWNNHEIELFDKDKDSYFDKYLDEILYLFEKSDVDTYVFEDIDRYEKNNIFNRLREINYLINEKLRLKEPDKRSIRFIYLIKDEMFTSKDRTKFFDIIIPIVPIMDSTNSYNLMRDIFKEGGILKDFDEDFLERICLYIDDLRLLKNIYNEYRIYYERIEGTDDENKIELIPYKLLSLIIYKNIFPEDFALLQFQNGYVFHLFDNKTNLVKQLIEGKKSEIKENKTRINEINAEQLNNIDELDALMFTYPNEIEVKGKRSYEYDNRAEWIKVIKNNEYNVNINGLYRSDNENIKEEFIKMQENAEYQRRKKSIEDRQNNTITDLENKNIEITREIEQIYTLQLHELLAYVNDTKYFKMKFNDKLPKENGT